MRQKKFFLKMYLNCWYVLLRDAICVCTFERCDLWKITHDRSFCKQLTCIGYIFVVLSILAESCNRLRGIFTFDSNTVVVYILILN